MKIFAGKIVCCVGSGPSLTKEDCQLAEKHGASIVAVNNAWTMFDKCDVIYAGDKSWWDKNYDKQLIPAQRWTCDGRAHREYGLFIHKASGGYNSGLRALQFSVDQGARKIILLGYDCQLTNGKTHFHGDHQGLSNPEYRRFKMWVNQFIRYSKEIKKLDVINATRITALNCFKRQALEDISWH